MIAEPTKTTLSSHLARLTLLFALTLLFHFCGIGQLLTDLSYHWLNLAAQHPDGTRSVLLINASEEALAADEAYWLELVNEINSHYPAHIMLAVQPHNVGPSFYQALASGAPASIAIEPVLNANGVILTNNPQVSNILPRSWLLPIATNNDGTLGYHTTIPDNPNFVSAEILALQMGRAKTDGNNSASPTPPNYFRITAPNTARPLPQVSTDQVLESGLVFDLAADRWIVIGQGTMVPGAIAAGHRVPEVNSGLQQRGHLLVALIENRWLRALPNWGKGLIIAITAGLWYGLFTLVARKHRLWLYTAWVLTISLTLAAMLRWLYLQLPAAELVFMPFLYMAVDSYYRRREAKTAFNQVMAMTEARMVKQRAVSDFFISENYWEKILTMIRQTLQLEAVVILECSANSTQLNIVANHGYDKEIALEKRRDFRRPPYDTAIQHGKPIQPERPFFDIDPVTTLQFICPLYYGGKILGFCALSLLRETLRNIPRAEEIFQQYSTQIGELLYRRQMMTRGNLNLLPENINADSLPYDKSMILQRITALESQLISHTDMSNATLTSGLLYDLFGNLVLANSAAQAFARENNIAIFDCNSLDFLIALTNCSPTEGRQTLMDIIVHDSQAMLPVSTIKAHATHMVYIRLVHGGKESSQSSLAPQPFDAQGILFEVLDNSHLSRLYQAKKSLPVNLTASLVDMLQNANFSLSEVQNSLTTLNQSTGKTDKLEMILNEMSVVTTLLHQHLQASDDIISDGYFYIDMKPTLENSIERHRPQLLIHMIDITTDLPDDCELARASLNDLEKILECIWVLMLETPDQSSQLSIRLEQTYGDNQNTILCTFKSQDVGLTPKMIEAFNGRDFRHLSPSLSALRLACDDIDEWSGSLQLRSIMGQSTTISLALEAFSDPH